MVKAKILTMRWISTAFLIILTSEPSSGVTVEFGRIASRKAKALKEEPTSIANKAPKAAKEEDADPEFEEWSDVEQDNTMTSMSLELSSLSMSLPEDWDVFEVPSDSMSMTANSIYGEWGVDALDLAMNLDSGFSFSLSFSIETDDAMFPGTDDNKFSGKSGKMDKTKSPMMSKSSKKGVTLMADETESAEDFVDMDEGDFVETQLLSSSGSFVRVVSSGSCAMVGSAVMLSYVLGFFLF